MYMNLHFDLMDFYHFVPNISDCEVTESYKNYLNQINFVPL